MSLFSPAQMDKINEVAAKSKAALTPPAPTNAKGMTAELNAIAEKVKGYFTDSTAICITTPEDLHEYVSEVIAAGYAGIDTETTGLDRIHDTVVGASLYYPGGDECYIPIKHKIPIFDEPYKGQLTYEQVASELERLRLAGTKLIFANADFDLSMIYKDMKVDLIDVCYYDVLLAWRCLKENEPDNSLKVLYNKYVLKGKGDPMKFTDFFSPKLFPYCKPEVAKLYAGADARMTFELFQWQLPYVTKDHAKCKNAHLEAIADLVWNIEIPLIRVCQLMHRRGIYLDKDVANKLLARYQNKYRDEVKKLGDLVQSLLDNTGYGIVSKCPFRKGADFNPNSTTHVQYLCKSILNLNIGKSVDKNVLTEINLPVTNQILKVRNLTKLISTYVEKLPKAVTPDSKIHARFNSIGADTGRFSSADPNMQNIPSHAGDIRHMFRATAAQRQLIDCTTDDSNIVVSVNALNTVTLQNGDPVSVEKLQVDDCVKLLDNGKEIWVYVKSISTSDDDPCICNVVFGLQPAGA